MTPGTEGAADSRRSWQLRNAIQTFSPAQLARDPSGERARAAARCAGGLGSGRQPADQAKRWDVTSPAVDLHPQANLNVLPGDWGCMPALEETIRTRQRQPLVMPSVPVTRSLYPRREGVLKRTTISRESCHRRAGSRECQAVPHVRPQEVVGHGCERSPRPKEGLGRLSRKRFKRDNGHSSTACNTVSTCRRIPGGSIKEDGDLSLRSLLVVRHSTIHASLVPALREARPQPGRPSGTRAQAADGRRGSSGTAAQRSSARARHASSPAGRHLESCHPGQDMAKRYIRV